MRALWIAQAVLCDQIWKWEIPRSEPDWHIARDDKRGVNNRVGRRQRPVLARRFPFFSHWEKIEMRVRSYLALTFVLSRRERKVWRIHLIHLNNRLEETEQ